VYAQRRPLKAIRPCSQLQRRSVTHNLHARLALIEDRAAGRVDQVELHLRRCSHGLRRRSGAAAGACTRAACLAIQWRHLDGACHEINACGLHTWNVLSWR
jgi:hypothetical protein